MSGEDKLDIEKATSNSNNMPVIVGAIILFCAIAGMYLLTSMSFTGPDRAPITAANDDSAYFEDEVKPIERIYKPVVDERVEPVVIPTKPAVVVDKGVVKRDRLTFTGTASQQGSASSFNTDSIMSQIETAKSTISPGAIDDTTIAGRASGIGSSITESHAYVKKNDGAVINAGAVIPACLANAVNSALPGNLIASVSRDVYSSDGRTLLIPKHSQLYGEYQTGQTQGETRLFAIWHRARVDRDLFIDIGSPAGDNLGRSGFTAKVNSRFLKRFGAALLLSIMPVAIDRVIGEENKNEDLFDAASAQLNDAASIALNSSINLAPILSMPQGRCFNVMVAQDLNFKGVL